MTTDIDDQIRSQLAALSKSAREASRQAFLSLAGESGTDVLDALRALELVDMCDDPQCTPNHPNTEET